MATRLYLTQTLASAGGSLPTVSQTNLTINDYLQDSTVAKSLSLIKQGVQTEVFDGKYAVTGFALGASPKRAMIGFFVSPQVKAGFYGPGKYRFYWSQAIYKLGAALGGNRSSQTVFAVYLWRPSTGTIVRTLNNTNDRFLSNGLDLSSSAFQDREFAEDATNPTPEPRGWLAQDGDVFVLEVILSLIQTSGSTIPVAGSWFYGGNIVINGATFSAKTETRNSASFVEFPFDIVWLNGESPVPGKSRALFGGVTGT